jgi:hypothetical protein
MWSGQLDVYSREPICSAVRISRNPGQDMGLHFKRYYDFEPTFVSGNLTDTLPLSERVDLGRAMEQGLYLSFTSVLGTQGNQERKIPRGNSASDPK